MRKASVFSMIVCCWMLQMQAQQRFAIQANFNRACVGRNVSLGLQYRIGREALSVSAKYHFGSIIHDNNGNFYHDRFYPRTLAQHIGVMLEYNHYFSPKGFFIEPFFFLNQQFTCSDLRHQDMPGTEIFWSPRVLAIENFAGIGMKVPVVSNLSFFGRMGGGIGIFNPWLSQTSWTTNLFRSGMWDWEFIGMLSGGIQWELQNRKRSGAG